MPCEHLHLKTFNCKNFQTSGKILNEVLKSQDIVLLQEHWLFKCHLHLLHEVHKHVSASGKSIDFYDPISMWLRRCSNIIEQEN